jgi:DNA repair protein RecN (Recombination protein N)
MLTYLSIRDVAIAERIELELGPGFIVVTGETGAGKSILVNALHLLLGGRASEELIRAGCDSAEVEGLFELAEGAPLIARLEALDLADGRRLLVRRSLTRAGRNRAYVNDRSVALATLAELAAGLVDISGQHEHVRLADDATHRDILDAFGGLAEERAGVAAAVSALRALEAELGALEVQERKRAEREEYLRFGLGRIDELAPRPGELEELERERSRLRHAEKLGEGLAEVHAWLEEQEGSAAEFIGRARHKLEHLTRFDPGLGSVASSLDHVQVGLQEVCRAIAQAGEGLQADPGRLSDVDERLTRLRGLLRTHGPTVEDVLRARAELAGELASLEGLEGRRQTLGPAVELASREALALAGGLSGARQKAARRLAARLEKELAALAMPGARFGVELTAGGPEALTEHGLDQVRFTFSANPGEPLRPMARVASGGELSRLLLALKGVLAQVDPVPTYVFDEVDAGVGGAVAEVIGDRLAAAAGSHQVVCITHLPQIAAYAGAHLVVHKRAEQGRTLSVVARLADDRARVEELARMAGGRQVSEQARGHAREMLARARGAPAGKRRLEPKL